MAPGIEPSRVDQRALGRGVQERKVQIRILPTVKGPMSPNAQVCKSLGSGSPGNGHSYRRLLRERSQDTFLPEGGTGQREKRVLRMVTTPELGRPFGGTPVGDKAAGADLFPNVLGFFYCFAIRKSVCVEVEA